MLEISKELFVIIEILLWIYQNLSGKYIELNATNIWNTADCMLCHCIRDYEWVDQPKVDLQMLYNWRTSISKVQCKANATNI